MANLSMVYGVHTSNNGNWRRAVAAETVAVGDGWCRQGRWPAVVRGSWQQNPAQNRAKQRRVKEENRARWRSLDAGERDGDSGDFRRVVWVATEGWVSAAGGNERRERGS